MNATPAPRPWKSSRPVRHLVAILLVLLLTPVLLMACGGSSMASPTMAAPTMAAPTTATVSDPMAMVDDGFGSTMKAVDMASWQARPAYVKADPATQEAYVFAIEHSDVLQWMPCYCGCTAMGHGNNVDCFLKSHDAHGVAFEQHASQCGICVQTALTAKAMHARGASLLEIRQAIDKSMGGSGAPGTDTPMPPA